MRILLLAAALVIVFFLLRRRSRKGSAALSTSSDAVDHWLKENLPRALATRLAKKGIDRAHVASTLRGDPDASVVSAIEEAVRSIEIEYVRHPQSNEVEACARVRFDDGSEETIRTRMPYSEAPSSVRDDFERKATMHEFRTWDFPWMSAR